MNKIQEKLNLANEKLSKLEFFQNQNRITTQNNFVSKNLKKIHQNLVLANEKLSKLNNYEVGYEEKTIWYPIVRSTQYPVVTSKVKLKDLPVIPISKIENLYPIQYIDGGDLDDLQ
jgi:hypothetical protein